MQNYFHIKLIQHLVNSSSSDRKGFTLIELLVVVIIIGILGAIALPSFLSITTRAREAEAKSFLSSYITGQQSYFAQTNGFAPEFANLALGISANSNSYNFAFTVNTDRTLTTTENNAFVNAQPRTPDLKSAAGVINLGVTVDAQSGLSRFTIYSEIAGAQRPPLDQGNPAPALNEVFILSSIASPIIQAGYERLR